MKTVWIKQLEKGPALRRANAFFEKPFVSVVTGKADTRMYSLLDQLGRSDHLVTKDQINIDKMLVTDFSCVREKKSALRKTSLDFLQNSLKGL